MHGKRMLGLTVAATVLLGLLVSAACADAVRCTPLIRGEKIAGLCFVVYNTPEEKCEEAGCIFDVHFLLPGGCVFTRIISLPADWHGTGVPYLSSPWFACTTWPDPATSPSNPIGIGQLKRFCIGINPGCYSRQERICIRVLWVTTGARGEPLDEGVTKCCLPVLTQD